MNHRQHQQHPRGRTLWPFLAASVALNLAAAAWALSLRFHDSSHKQGSDDIGPTQAHTFSVAPTVATPPQKGPRPHSEPSSSPRFQWKQLESESYDTYISRLREIGCPESTIKDILIGELKAGATDKRAELERKILRSSDWSPPPGVSRQEFLAAQLRKLDREIELAASDLMQTTAVPGSPDPVVAATSPVRYPAVLDDVSFQPGSSGQMRYVEPGVVEVPQEQLASIQEIQDSFVQEIGGPNQDVEDPQYEQAWRTAQWKADQILRARHGWAAYGDLQRAAAQKAYEAQQNAAAGQ